MTKSKDTILTEDSQLRDLVLSEGWSTVLEPWIKSRIDDLKEEMAKGLDHDQYFSAVGGAQALKMILQEVTRRGRRKSADIPEPD